MSEKNTTPEPSAHEGSAEHPRAIRSFVIRGGRLTSSQENALAMQWPRFGLEAEAGVIEPAQVFGRHAPLIMEIGFGMGDSLLTMASANPEQDFIGVEVHKPGVGRLLHEIADQQLNNLRIYRHDAKEILRDCIAAETLDCIQIFFPDPWHKKRHNKRRLVQSEFIEQLRPKLKIGGILHMATDWVPYAEHMMEVMSAAPGFSNPAGAGQYSSANERPLTKFEKRGQRLGHVVNDLIFVREI
jgi:tRNA (guanine-N7-)-methyltransferase